MMRSLCQGIPPRKMVLLDIEVVVFDFEGQLSHS